jgi:p-hydroxybenzoate 3-monooxygenase
MSVTASGAQELATRVCIVGAGPAGLVVALRLQQAGVDCLLVEQLDSAQLCAKTKAGMIEHQSVQALAAVDLAGPILERGSRNGLLEFRVDGQPLVFDYAALTGGQGHHVLPQQLLVEEWLQSFAARGGSVALGHEAVALRVEPGGADVAAPGAAQLALRDKDGQSVSVRCQVVVLASGAGTRLLPDGIECLEHTYPFRWLTAMIGTPPLGERTIYASHARGFAAHLRRAPQLTRYYLQISERQKLSDWSDERLRSELALRLGLESVEPLLGEVVERDLMDLRVRVREPLQRGCVYLAGDAAHLITPAGGKGMNLAIQDALELAAGLSERLVQGRPERLARYSDTRLPRIWEAQEFSNWMLALHCGGVMSLHRSEPEPDDAYARRLHRAQIERLFTDAGFARWFAHRYAGVAEPA